MKKNIFFLWLFLNSLYAFCQYIPGGNRPINNGNIRFGQDSQNSINTSGNLLQPFYYSDLVLEWRQLTYEEQVRLKYPIL